MVLETPKWCLNEHSSSVWMFESKWCLNVWIQVVFECLRIVSYGTWELRVRRSFEVGCRGAPPHCLHGFIQISQKVGGGRGHQPLEPLPSLPPCLLPSYNYVDVYCHLQCIAFRDVNPMAPTHVLIIPRKPIPMLAQAEDTEEETKVRNRMWCHRKPLPFTHPVSSCWGIWCKWPRVLLKMKIWKMDIE